MREIIDGIIWLFVGIFLLLMPFCLVFMLWGDYIFWLRMLGTSFGLFFAFWFIGKVTDRLIKTGGFNQ